MERGGEGSQDDNDDGGVDNNLEDNNPVLPDIGLKDYEVQKGPLKMKVFLRKDKRFKYVRIYDFLYEAFIESNEALEDVTPQSPILIDLRLLVEEVRKQKIIGK
jgi:hypothetical protein